MSNFKIERTTETETAAEQMPVLISIKLSESAYNMVRMVIFHSLLVSLFIFAAFVTFYSGNAKAAAQSYEFYVEQNQDVKKYLAATGSERHRLGVEIVESPDFDYVFSEKFEADAYKLVPEMLTMSEAQMDDYFDTKAREVRIRRLFYGDVLAFTAATIALSEDHSLRTQQVGEDWLKKYAKLQTQFEEAAFLDKTAKMVRCGIVAIDQQNILKQRALAELMRGGEFNKRKWARVDLFHLCTKDE
jgi:hypothetical protein